MRLALHTGETDLGEGDYYGTEANRCARLREIAEPGQALVSQATWVLVRDRLPEGVTLRDLGKHTLRDFPDRTPTFQLSLSRLAEY